MTESKESSLPSSGKLAPGTAPGTASLQASAETDGLAKSSSPLARQASGGRASGEGRPGSAGRPPLPPAQRSSPQYPLPGQGSSPPQANGALRSQVGWESARFQRVSFSTYCSAVGLLSLEHVSPHESFSTQSLLAALHVPPHESSCFGDGSICNQTFKNHVSFTALCSLPNITASGIVHPQHRTMPCSCRRQPLTLQCHWMAGWAA